MLEHQGPVQFKCHGYIEKNAHHRETSAAMCIRPANEKEVPVMRIPFGSKNDLHEHSRTVYNYHRKGGMDLPKGFEKKLEGERRGLQKQ